MAKAKLILDKRYKAKDGLYSLKFRISNSNTVDYINLEYKLKANEWKQSDCKIDSTCKRYNAVQENIKLKDFTQDFDKFLLDLSLKRPLSVYTASELKTLFEDSRKFSDVDDVETLFNMFIEEKRSKNPKGGTPDLYENTLKLLKSYNKQKRMKFSSITPNYLDGFEKYLRAKGNKQNYIALNMRNVRAVYNYGLKLNVLEYNLYPFRSYKIKHEKTSHRTIAIEDLIKIFNYQGTLVENRAVDLFKLSFYLIGINFKDLLYLKHSDVYNDRISYKRSKTGKDIAVKIMPVAKKLIEKYKGDKYLLNLMEKKKAVNPADRETPVHTDITHSTNKALKRICKKLKINVDISTYYTRHTWATVARSQNVEYDIIQRALGHKNSDVTAIYIEYDDSMIDEANVVVAKYIVKMTKSLALKKKEEFEKKKKVE